MSVSKVPEPAGASASIVGSSHVDIPLSQQQVVIFSSNQCLFQALNSSLELAAGVRCTCRHCLPGGAFSDASADENSVFLLDCLSFDEQRLEQYFLEESANHFDGHEVVLFNVNKDWHVHQKGYAQKIRGFFYQDDSKSVFIEGMRTILKGGNLSQDSLAMAHARTFPPTSPSPEQQLNSLSPREKEILQIISEGMKNAEISAELAISLNTVKTHIYNIYKKIGVSNRLQAAIWATANCISRV